MEINLQEWKNNCTFALLIAKRKEVTMENRNFRNYTDEEFKAALIATMNLKNEWLASVEKRERELGLR